MSSAAAPVDPAVPEAGPSKPKSSASKPRKRFVGTSTPSSSGRKAAPRVPLNQVPAEILDDPELNDAIRLLPSNYNFEIHKTIHQIRRDSVTAVALQMPEGLMIYGCLIGDILERFTGAHPILLADVTYGACCIDDYTAKSLGAEMIVHYGHSCLIPTTQTTLKTLYVFVEIAIDMAHLSATVRTAFPSSKPAFARGVLESSRGKAGEMVGRDEVDRAREEEAKKGRGRIALEAPAATADGDVTGTDVTAAGSLAAQEAAEGAVVLPTKLALVSTIQFVAAVQHLRTSLESALPPLDDSAPTAADGNVGDGALVKRTTAQEEADEVERRLWRGKYEVVIPQARPLSPGEILGCTAPRLADDVDALIYVGDGRFHLESIMIANPTVPAFRYDPYDKKFTRETYDHQEMREVRAEAVGRARKTLVGSGGGGEAEEGKGSGAWAVVLGTLGRQGSVSVLNSITSSIPKSSLSAHAPLPILISELSPAKLAMFPPSISTFVQTSCPRLSIDWGMAFQRPVLTPYEAALAVGRVTQVKEDTRKAGWEAGFNGNTAETYPMDFYADDSLGPWTPRHGLARPKRTPATVPASS